MVEGKPYWRDVGTIDAYWEANLDLTHITPELNLYDEEWPIWSYQEQLPPAKFVFEEPQRCGAAFNSLVSGGCIVSGSLLRRSLLFSNVHVHSYCTIEDSVILGGFYTPGVGIVDSLQAGTLMRQKAQDLGALTIAASVEVTGIDVEGGQVRRVHTDAGTIEADYVVIACGCWSPRIARMAGATIPLTPAVHQMIDVGPVPMFEGTVGEIAYPIIRDVDVVDTAIHAHFCKSCRDFLERPGSANCDRHASQCPVERGPIPQICREPVRNG